MQINHANVKIIVPLSFIKIHSILKSSLEKFTQMKYNVLLCRCRLTKTARILLSRLSRHQTITFGVGRIKNWIRHRTTIWYELEIRLRQYKFLSRLLR
jgi:hypothetical protein